VDMEEEVEEEKEIIGTKITDNKPNTGTTPDEEEATTEVEIDIRALIQAQVPAQVPTLVNIPPALTPAATLVAKSKTAA
jgi:hypothetical protein